MMDHHCGAAGAYFFFWGGPFSQWAKYPMEIDGIRYVTCEQYMMAEKARLFDDRKAEAAIRTTPNPRQQKALGRTVRGFDQATWETAREEIVYRANLAKFSQNATLRDMLLATGDRIVAEASPQDEIWGIGMADGDARIEDTSLWGLNLLGKAIMRVREELRRQEVQESMK